MTDETALQSRRSRIAEFAAYCVDSKRSSLRPFLRRPVTAVKVLHDVLQLPMLEARLGSGAETAAVRAGIKRAHPTHTPLDALTSLLVLPSTLEEYTQAPARRSVRRKVRVADKSGITWAPVRDPHDRAELKAIADAREQVHPDPTYRRATPANQDLLAYDLWLAAYGPEGEPLMIAVIPTDGEWAVLRYFRTLTEGDNASVARYLLSEVLVGELIARGVRYLVDTESPFVLPNGLRHFQRMVGYELFRVRLLPAPTTAPTPAIAPPHVEVVNEVVADLRQPVS